MSKVKIIAVSGKLGHGKDTLVQCILNEIKAINQKDIRHNVSNFLTLGKLIDTKRQVFPYQVAFADPIKKVAQLVYPMLTHDDLWGPSKNREKVLPDYINPKTGEMLSVRDILTQLGAWGRSTNKDCWINSTLGLMDHVVNNCKAKHRKHLFIFSDVRFRNEKAAIERRGGNVIRIIRPSVVSISNDESEIDLDNVSLDKFGAVVYNNKDIDHLQKEAHRIVQHFLHK